MAAVPAVFGLIAAVSGLVAVVARFRFDPFYSVFVKLSPKTRRLQAAREALADGRRIRIADEQEILELIHRVAAEEYDNISEQWTPVEFRWMHNTFRFRYAEQREEGKQNRPDIEAELVGYVDERIAAHLGRIAAGGTIIAILGFALAVLAAVL